MAVFVFNWSVSVFFTVEYGYETRNAEYYESKVVDESRILLQLGLCCLVVLGQF